MQILIEVNLRENKWMGKYIRLYTESELKHKLLIKILKSSIDEISTVLIAYKIQPSKWDCLSKYEQTHRLMQIRSDTPKKSITENSNISGIFSKFPYFLKSYVIWELVRHLVPFHMCWMKMILKREKIYKYLSLGFLKIFH